MKQSKVRDGVFGFCVGDALGVPVEFLSRSSLTKDPVEDMIGYGSHSQPAGTWSDDSSLLFCLMESAALYPQIDLVDLADRFTKWYKEGYWTPHGVVFDVGIATAEAIGRFKQHCIRPDFAGGADEYSNGNGSLMRILPLAYLLKDESFEDRAAIIAQVSSLTHRHRVSIIACVMYVELTLHLLEGATPSESVSRMRETILSAYGYEERQVMARFDRLLKDDLAALPMEDIESSGYVIHTLEASIWSLLTTESYKDAVLRAVNLGDDTDTTGAVTGGLAGIYYGLESIPAEWINDLARLGDIEDLCRRFEAVAG
ncbi:ADP-ribosylglycohydrolase family protein [Paenibacillus arenilitoris]|uniref:ADP-ribosylglycohydrolase family protein n=1 Tax=Paenibacillus arenilitoris TaxID=2772299 RepID=A0A927CPL1_9BACL|nr:ADP-ribosylglycohydrolase family protein [Paenibacillus arenilitoris]MBD2871152.1 ADP-ribosylglycohydrolase family protein [Paenibacillus arenilitoris]